MLQLTAQECRDEGLWARHPRVCLHNIPLVPKYPKNHDCIVYHAQSRLTLVALPL